MWFWLFMTVGNLILPVLMIVLGKAFIKIHSNKLMAFTVIGRGN